MNDGVLEQIQKIIVALFLAVIGSVAPVWMLWFTFASTFPPIQKTIAEAQPLK